MQDNTAHFGDALERFLIETASALKRFAANENMNGYPEAEKRLEHLIRDMFSLACDIQQAAPTMVPAHRVRLNGNNGARKELSR